MLNNFEKLDDTTGMLLIQHRHLGNFAIKLDWNDEKIKILDTVVWWWNETIQKAVCKIDSHKHIRLLTCIATLACPYSFKLKSVVLIDDCNGIDYRVSNMIFNKPIRGKLDIKLPCCGLSVLMQDYQMKNDRKIL